MRIPNLASLAVFGLALTASLPAQTWTWPAAPLFIPDAAVAGTCTFPVFATIDVPPGATVTDVNLALDLSHPFAGNLRIVLHHGGLAVTLADTIPYDSSPLGSTYVFDDEAPVSFDAGMIATVGLAPVPGGPYRPDGFLSTFDGQPRGGPWILEICDLAPGFTGILGGFIINISSVGGGGLNYVVNQIVLGAPVSGLTRVEMIVTGGVTSVPTNFCLKVWTANLGNYPNGWFFGIDPAFNDVLVFHGSGWPFFQLFSIVGEAYSYFDGIPVGLGVTLYTVAVELGNATSIPVHWSAPTAITLL